MIDAHLDLAWNALSFNRDQTETIETINRREVGMTDYAAREGACVSLPEMRQGRIGVCLATNLGRTRGAFSNQDRWRFGPDLETVESNR